MGASAGIDLLYVEDDSNDARVVERLLHDFAADASRRRDERTPIETIEHVTRLEAGVERASSTSLDVVLLDLNLPDSTGLGTLDAMVEHAPSVPVVVLTGQTDVGVDAIRRGAQDYVVKPELTAELLGRTLRYAVERARVQRELRDRNHRLALLNRIIRTDVRDDVSMIVGWTDRVYDRADEDDRAALESVLEASDHLLDVTDTAAELVDVISTGADGYREPRDLDDVLDPALDALRRAHDVELAVDRSVPDAESVVVPGSAALRSAFDHLLTNAAIHTDRETPRVDVAVEATEGRVSVAIADDGVGMPDAQKDALADPGATGDRRPGVGAGLYFVTTVLEELGADLEVRDNHPRGTVVTVVLDRVRPR